MLTNSIVGAVCVRLEDTVLIATGKFAPRVTAPRPPSTTSRPHERIVRVREVVYRVGVHRGTIYRWIKDGRFPRQVALGANSAGWYEADVDAWIADPTGWNPAS